MAETKTTPTELEDTKSQNGSNEGFGYSADGSSEHEPNVGRRLLSFASRRKVPLIIGAGIITPLFGAALISLLGLLNPLRLNLIDTELQTTYMARMLHVFDRRSEKFLISLLTAEVAGNTTGGSPRNIFFQARGVDPAHPFGFHRYRDARAGRYADRIADRLGFRYERMSFPDGSADVLVRINMDGLKNVDFKSMRSELGLLNLDSVSTEGLRSSISETFNNNRRARRELNRATKELHPYNAFRRIYVRKVLRDTLGITRWVFFENTRDGARRSVQQKWNRAAVNYLSGGRFVSCLFSTSNCPKVPTLNHPDSKNPASLEGRAQQARSVEEDLQNTREVDPDNPRWRRLEIAQNMMRRIVQAIKYTAIADIIITIDDLLGKETNALRNMIAVARQAEYASSYAEFQKIRSQMAAGENISPEEADAAMEMFSCIEFSDAYQNMVQLKGGTAFSPPAGSVYAQAEGGGTGSEDCPFAQLTEDLKPNGDSPGGTIANTYQNTFGVVLSPLVSQVKRSGLDRVLDILNRAIGFVAEPIVDAGVALVRGISGFDIKDALSQVGEDLMVAMGGAPACTAEEGGGQLFNCIAGGATTTQETTLQNHGGHALAAQERVELNKAIAERRIEERSHRSLWSRLASLDTPDSFLAGVIMRSPYSPRSLLSQPRRLLAMLNPLHLLNKASGHAEQASYVFAGPAYAQSAVDGNELYGIKAYGFTDEELDAELFGDKTLAQCEEEKRQFLEALSSGDEDRMDRASSLCLLDEAVVDSHFTLWTQEENSIGGAVPITAEREELNDRVINNSLWKSGAGPTNDVVNGVAKDDLVKLLVAIMEQGDFPILASTIKAGHSACTTSGRTSNHTRGLAVDIANIDVAPEMFRWLYENRETLGLNELIFSPVPSGARNLTNGQHHNYSASVMGQHEDHIHVSVQGERVSAGCPND